MFGQRVWAIVVRASRGDPIAKSARTVIACALVSHLLGSQYRTRSLGSLRERGGGINLNNLYER